MNTFALTLSSLLTLFGLFNKAQSVCPYLLHGTPSTGNDESIPDLEKYDEALSSLDISAVFDDLYKLMLNSQECWPADEFNNEKSYAGLFIRLAWHCAGTYRHGDGKGGCGGGRQRFPPESTWDDNVNLDKARALLGPIKEKYGDALSWGDLFIFSGTAAILQGGGPVTEVCAGRVDNTNGTLSDPLIHQSYCNIVGNCTLPMGQSTLGLIYVNPEGYLGVPDPIRTAEQIRDVFKRMDMNDIETVALIGGGHAFGKAHGSCPLGAGNGPHITPNDPWPGLCGNNFPKDSVTSGLEGQWTTNPFQWDNEYFTQLINDKYTLIKGPGGKNQWKNDRNGYLMLTTDVALVNDNSFKEIVNDFANNIETLNKAFSEAWEKLVTSGGTWSKNKFCVNSDKLTYVEKDNKKAEL